MILKIIKYKLVPIVFMLCNTMMAKAVEIKGEVIDTNSKQKIAYVSISVKSKNGNNLGVMSNEKGEFTLNIYEIGSQDEVTFSHVNYKVRSIKITDLINNSLVELTTNNFMLDEVKITSTPILKILAKAVEDSSNLLEKNIVLNSYTREITKIDGQFKNISDAMIDYYISKKNGKSKLVINQSRAFIKDPENLKKNLSVYNVQTLIKKAYDFRLIRAVMNKDNYDYLIYDQTEEAKEYTYVKIIPNKNVTELLYEGYIKIDPQNNLIIESKLYTSKEHMQYAKYMNMIFFEVRFENSMEWTKFQIVEGKYILVYNKDLFGFSAKIKEEEHKYDFGCDIFIQSLQEDIKVPNETYDKKSIFEAGTNYKNNYWEQAKTYPLTEEELDYIKSF